MTVPAIVFIHDGNSDYLRYSLAQARLTSPESQVCLIGNEHNNCYPFVKHFHFRDYISNAIAFSNNYLHLSPNHRGFELFCFVRWFILRDFMLLNKLEQAVYLDSDIMLYDDLRLDLQVAESYGLALCGVAPPTIITNLVILDEFCRLLEETYGSPEGHDWLKQRYQTMQKSGIVGGICDMTFWELLQDSCPQKILDLSLPDSQGAVYDRNIQQPDGFLMQDGIKQVTWHQGIPFCTRQDGSKIRIKALHFHGEKNRMRLFFNDWFTHLSSP